LDHHAQHQWLDEIVQAKHLEIEGLRASVPLSALERQVKPRAPGRFRQALLENRADSASFAIIAEAKKASPSRGVLCSTYDPVAIARSYQAAGACALSVLTDSAFFQGSLEDLRQVKAAVTLPVLRKDFTISEYQVFEAAAAGADAVLLIVAILHPGELRSLLQLSRELGMDALVEVHTASELAAALDAGSEMIGVNNRDLRTFQVSLQVSIDLIEDIPDTITAISESGLRSRAHLETLRSAGFDAFLIGERLMTEADPGAALRALLAGAPQAVPAASRPG
jgi:indole-3-glycerol phosphate synthase